MLTALTFRSRIVCTMIVKVSNKQTNKTKTNKNASRSSNDDKNRFSKNAEIVNTV